MSSSKLFVPQGVLAESHGKLSTRSRTILQVLARGHFKAELFHEDFVIDREEIIVAAQEALVLNSAARTREERIAMVRRRFARAYEEWTPEEELHILGLYNSGKTMRQIALDVQRQPNAIKSRLIRMGKYRHVAAPKAQVAEPTEDFTPAKSAQPFMVPSMNPALQLNESAASKFTTGTAPQSEPFLR